MKEKMTPYLKKMMDDEFIALQYQKRTFELDYEDYNDPLMEDSHEMVKGLIHKYPNRALIKVSYQCAAHCRFCTRIRQIGKPEGNLSDDHINGIVNYLRQHPEIEDVILSGGDPFVTPKVTIKLLEQIQEIESVKVVRIGTRLAVQSPKSIETKSIKRLLDVISETVKKKPFYLLLHVEHPNELTEEAVKAIQFMKSETGTTLLSQTVFLKGINVDYETMYELFKKLYFIGVTPYYLYHCDTVKGLEHFIGDIEVEKEIVKKLRNNLSGIATPTFVVDLENGYGKYPVDLNMLGLEQ